MPIIEFVFYSAFKRIAGVKKISMEVGYSVKDAINALNSRFGNEMKSILLDSKETLKGNLIFSLNGIDIRKLKGVNTPLKSGDSIALVPAFAGG